MLAQTSVEELDIDTSKVTEPLIDFIMTRQTSIYSVTTGDIHREVKDFTLFFFHSFRRDKSTWYFVLKFLCH